MVKEGVVKRKDEKLEFNHQSFAEYFCSKYIFDKLKIRNAEGVQKLLLKEPMKNFKFFHKFFLHSLLRYEQNILGSVRDSEIVEKILSAEDIYGENILDSSIMKNINSVLISLVYKIWSVS